MAISGIQLWRGAYARVKFYEGSVDGEGGLTARVE